MKAIRLASGTHLSALWFVGALKMTRKMGIQVVVMLAILGPPMAHAGLTPNTAKIDSIARTAICAEQPRLAATNLEIASFYYMLQNRRSLKSVENYFDLSYRIKDTIETIEDAEQTLVYYDEIRVRLKPDGAVSQVFPIQPFVEHNVHGSGGYNGPAMAKPLVLHPRPPESGGHPIDLSTIPTMATTKDILQAFSDLANEEIVVEQHIFADQRTPLVSDGPPSTLEEAIQVLTATLASRYIFVEPIDSNRSHASRRTIQEK